MAASPTSSRTPRPPVRWATHSQQILFVFAVTVGGLSFGISYTLWPLTPVERWLGVGVLAVVIGIWVRVVIHLRRPVQEPPRRGR